MSFYSLLTFEYKYDTFIYGQYSSQFQENSCVRTRRVPLVPKRSERGGEESNGSDAEVSQLERQGLGCISLVGERKQR